MNRSSTSAKLKNYTLLYAEDDDITREMMSRVLKSMSNRVFVASDGEEALDIFLKERPDIVITDILMPKMTGLELTREIKKVSPSTDVVVITAHSDSNFFMSAIECKVDRFLIKPVSIQDLAAVLDEFCEEIELRAEIKKGDKLLSEYKKAVDAAAIVSKTDKEGIITYVNDQMCIVSGFSREELIGQSQNIVRHPNMPSSVFEEMWSTILGGGVWKGILENRAKNGESYWVEATIVPIMDENEQIVEFIGIRTDITKLIEQEKEIERLRSKLMKESVEKALKVNFKKMIELNPLPAFVLNSEDIVVAYNKAFRKLFDPFGSEELFESIDLGKIGVEVLFEKEGLMDGYSGAAFSFKDMPLGVDVENETLTLKNGLDKKSYFVSIFKSDQESEPFWIVYLANC